MKIKISIILPAYNSAKYINLTIKSILSQSYRQFELIIIVDPSSDNTIQEIKKFKDKRIVLVINKIRLGLSRTLNSGIKKAKSEFIARADSDDFYPKNRLKEQYSYLLKNPTVDIVGANTITFEKNKKIRFYYPQKNDLIKWGMAFFCPFSHPTIMVKKEIFYRYGFYPITKFEDYNFYIKLVDKIKFANIPQFLCYKRKHDENLSTIKDEADRSEESKGYARFILKMYNIRVKKNQVDILIYGTTKRPTKNNVKQTIKIIKTLRNKFIEKFPKEKKSINVDTVLRIIIICLENKSFYNLFINIFYFFTLDKFFFYHFFLKLFNRYILNKHNLVALNEK